MIVRTIKDRRGVTLIELLVVYRHPQPLEPVPANAQAR